MNFHYRFYVLAGILLPLLAASLNSQQLACRMEVNGEECVGHRAFLVGGLSTNSTLKIEVTMYPGNRIEVYSPSFQRLALIRFGETGFALTSGMAAIQTFSAYPNNEKHGTNSKISLSIGSTNRSIYVKMGGVVMAELPVVGIPYMFETDISVSASKFVFTEGPVVSSSYCVVGNSSCNGTRMALLENGFTSAPLVIRSTELTHADGLFSFGIAAFTNYMSTPVFEIAFNSTHIFVALEGSLVTNKAMSSALGEEVSVKLQPEGSKMLVFVNENKEAELQVSNSDKIHYLYQTASNKDGYSYQLE